MQYILTKSGNRLPFYNIRKVTDNNNQPVSIVISFRKSELQAENLSVELLTSLMKDTAETTELSLYNESGILLNTYHNYSKLDETICKYNYLISSYIPATESEEKVEDEEGNVIIPAIEGTEEVLEVRDMLFTVILLKQSDLELKVEDASRTVDAITIAMADMMGV